MINRDLLRAAWVACGESQADAAKRLHISDRTMTQRMTDGLFYSDEIETLIKAYNIKNPMLVFFPDSVT